MAAKNGRVVLNGTNAADVVQAGASGGTFNVEILNASGSTAIVSESYYRHTKTNFFLKIRAIEDVKWPSPGTIHRKIVG